jgi:hypothetical protein
MIAMSTLAATLETQEDSVEARRKNDASLFSNSQRQKNVTVVGRHLMLGCTKP